MRQSGIGNKGIGGLEFNARETGTPRKVILRERGAFESWSETKLGTRFLHLYAQVSDKYDQDVK